MSFQTNFTKTMNFVGQAFKETIPVTSDAVNNIAPIIVFNAVDVEVAFTVDNSELQAFAMLADQDMTVDTNSSGAPQETFNLLAGVPVFFTVGDPAIFLGDVTALFVTNVGGVEATLKVSSATNTLI